VKAVLQKAKLRTNGPKEASFISDLLEGTFESVVDSSTKQMDAYGDLQKNVAGKLNEFDPSTLDQASSSSDRTMRNDDDN
jgi:hypothetical protein